MAAAALEERTEEEEENSADLDARVARELAEIVQEAERVSEPDVPEVARWCYLVPFPGVRYYLDRERPSPVKSKKRPRGARTVR